MKVLLKALIISKNFYKAVKKVNELTGGDKIVDAFYKAYRKPLPLWRILFCSYESNSRWYDKRIKQFLLTNNN